ncbi:NAD(P)/FAD-dependent oxidoreductase [Halocola ammonii]
MSQPERYDFLIVGQGLAGTVLGHELQRRGYSVFFIDKGHAEAASYAAAGMWNPIVFRRLNKSWRADDLIPVADDFYKDLEKKLSATLRFPKNIARVFPDNEAANDFHARSAEPGFEHFLKTTSIPEVDADFTFQHGYGVVEKAGYLDLRVLLKKYREWLKSENLIDESEFEFEALKLMPSGAQYGSLEAGKIVFCEGHLGTDNPYFGYLPLHKNKGELLTVKIAGLSHRSIVNNGQFLLPVGDDLYRVGATYEWKSADLTTSDEAREKLLSRLREVVKAPIEVIEHRAGIRPTTQDRRPLIGAHPNNERLMLFNGLGTKGVMNAPYFAINFCDWVQGKSELDSEVDIGRFRKHFDKQEKA